MSEKFKKGDVVYGVERDYSGELSVVTARVKTAGPESFTLDSYSTAFGFNARFAQEDRDCLARDEDGAWQKYGEALDKRLARANSEVRTALERIAEFKKAVGAR